MDDAAPIAFIGPYPPIRGGIAQHGAGVVGALRAAGVAVDVISWRAQYPRLLYPGEQVAIDGDLTTHYLLWWSPFSWLRARRQIRQAPIVVFPWVSPVHTIPLKIILSGAHGKIVAIVHNALPHERMPFASRATSWVLRRADGNVTHSEAVATELAAIVEGPGVEVTPHPPNVAIEPTPLPPGPVRLLFFGYIRDYKGVDLLIESLAELRSRGHDVAATVAGEAWEDPAGLLKLADELDVADAVDFRIGYVDDSEIPALMRDHHIVVQPYRSASQSGVVPIAYAAGRPVVVTPVGGLGETVRDGENGIVAAGVDTVSIADAIERAAAQRDLLAAGAARCAPSWAAVAAAVLAAAGVKGEFR